MSYLSLLAAPAALAVAAGVAMSTAAAEEDPGRPDVAKCTHVLGFSQTADWFMAPVFRGFLPNPVQSPEAGAIFESIVDGDKWQLQWTNGAGVDVYANPNAAAWNSPIISACEKNSDRPERLVYMISGPHGLNIAGWVADIEIALNNIRAKFPSVEVIALQPVVGAPVGDPDDSCPSPLPLPPPLDDGTGRVRASWQATPILEAVEIVAGNHPDVVAGATTRVRSCGHFVDGIGHLSNGQMLSGAATVAVDTGLFYRDFDWNCSKHESAWRHSCGQQ